MGVLYPMAGGNYGNGVAWNGLIGVNESPEGGEPNDMWADTSNTPLFRGASQFKATIEAYTYPDEFAACIGELQFVPGVYAGQQKLKPFWFLLPHESRQRCRPRDRLQDSPRLWGDRGSLREFQCD